MWIKGSPKNLNDSKNSMDIFLTVIASILLTVGFFVICKTSDDDDEEEEPDENKS
jgi:hypothetical protein